MVESSLVWHPFPPAWQKFGHVAAVQLSLRESGKGGLRLVQVAHVIEENTMSGDEGGHVLQDTSKNMCTLTQVWLFGDS